MDNNKSITGNYFICGNEVFVEGQSIGQFQSFSSDDNRKSIEGTAEIKMPFYSMAAKAAKSTPQGSSVVVKRVGKNVVTYVRINPDDWKIKVGARIQVYIWYHNNPTLGQTFEKRLEFDGYIREVTGGFPTTIKCEDASFMLRFGTVSKSWTQATKTTALLSEMCDIANNAFAEYRSKNGLTNAVPKLVPAGDSLDSEFVLKPASAVSPYDILMKVILGMYKWYVHTSVTTDNEGNEQSTVWTGLGLKENTDATVQLDTSVNVIGCSLVPKDMMFDNFKVIVRYLDSGELKSVTKGSENGIVYDIPYTPNRTADQMKQMADSALQGLKAERNKGALIIPAYPLVKLFDYINFTHTIFTELSGGYYVIGRQMRCDNQGYHQILSVTDKTFVYLS